MKRLDRDQDGRLTLQGRVERLELETQLIYLSIVLVILAGLLSGCNMSDGHARWLWNTPDAGKIHARNYTPESTTWISGTSGTCSGTPQVCTPGTPGHMQYNPPSWSLDLYAPDGDHGWTDVSEGDYNKCAVGEQYPDCVKNTGRT